MKIKVPPQIKLGTYTYRVKYNRNLLQDWGMFAKVNDRTQEIEIAVNIAQSIRNIALLHEVIHCLGDIYRISVDDGDTERLAQGIAEFLFNNLDIELDWSDISED